MDEARMRDHLERQRHVAGRVVRLHAERRLRPGPPVRLTVTE